MAQDIGPEICLQGAERRDHVADGMHSVRKLQTKAKEQSSSSQKIWRGEEFRYGGEGGERKHAHRA